jgi:hypothetical protein
MTMRDVFAEWPDTHYLSPTEIEEMEMESQYVTPLPRNYANAFPRFAVDRRDFVFPLPRDYARYVRRPFAAA